MWKKATPEMSPDTSDLHTNGDTLSSTQEKSTYSCGTDENTINLDSRQPTSVDTSVSPENVDSTPVIDITKSDKEMLSLLKTKKKPRCEQ